MRVANARWYQLVCIIADFAAERFRERIVVGDADNSKPRVDAEQVGRQTDRADEALQMLRRQVDQQASCLAVDQSRDDVAHVRDIGLGIFLDIGLREIEVERVVDFGPIKGGQFQIEVGIDQPLKNRSQVLIIPTCILATAVEHKS